MKLKFRTEKACFHNGRYYEADSIVECDCKFCKEGSVSYFTKLDDNNETKEEVAEQQNVSQETITDEKKEEVKESKPKRKNKIEIV